MLTKTIKIPNKINIYFFLLDKKKYIVIKNSVDMFSIYIKIPFGINISKKVNNLIINKEKSLQSYDDIGSFTNIVNGLFNSFKVLSKKTLIYRGLGLRSFLNESILILKLGNSYDNNFIFDRLKTKIITGKNFITLVSFDKNYLGNCAENLRRLKMANCFKSRGLYYKNKKFLTKIIKKS